MSGVRGSLRGVLLDVDGTLIDSNDAHARAWSDAFREFGLDLPPERVRPLVGMGGDKLMPELTGIEEDSDQGRRLTERRSAIFAERYLPTLHAFPGAHELLVRFKERGLKLVIATSSDAEQLNAMLEQTGLGELVERKTSSSDASHSKPDPDIISAALKKGGLTAAEALMLGDTPYDIEAAAKAGVPTVTLESGGWRAEDLQGSLAVFANPADLLARFANSPFG